MFMVPTMFIRLLKLPEEVRRKFDLSSLEVHHPCGGALPHRREAGDDRLVGSGDQRVLWLHRIERGHARHQRRHPEKTGHRGAGGRRRRAAHPRRRGPDAAGGRRRRDLHALRGAARLHLPQQAAGARRHRPGGLHHLRRRRLSRRGRLPLPVRPQARHGDLGRRQHLSSRDRGGAAHHAGGEGLRGVRHPGRASSARR